MSDYRDLKKYYPTLVSNESGKKTPGEGKARVVRLHALPPKTQKILLSDRIVDFIYGVEQRFHLNDMETEEFSRTVRQFFFREITEGGFAKKVADLCKISHDEALKLLSTIKTLDVDTENTQEEKSRNIVQMPLAQARERYPQIMNQLVTQDMITSQKFSEPLKPSVQNWIAVYEKTLDVSSHNAIERGNFVYRADATRNLTPQERQKLATIFKSRDEGTPLMIDQDRGIIIFRLLENSDEQRNQNNKTQEQEGKKGFFGTGVYLNKKSHSLQDRHTMHSAAKEIGRFAQKSQRRPQIQKQRTGNDHSFQDTVNRSGNMENVDERSFEKQISQEEQELARTTQKMEKMINDMKKTVGNERNIGQAVQTESGKSMGVQSSLANEIAKNREEMYGRSDEKKEGQQRTSQKPSAQKSVTQSNTHAQNSVGGNMTFSSNHTLPSEQEKKPKNNKKNYYHISPIGQDHVIRKDDRI